MENMVENRGTVTEGGQKARSASVRSRERTCAACRRVTRPEELVRWVRDEDGGVIPDLRGTAFGRGAWLHPRKACLSRFVPALSRSFRATVTTTEHQAVELLRIAADKRVRELLGAARRQRKLELGSAAVEDALGKDQARAVLVARDARAAAELPGVRRAVASGLAAAWGSKESLGQIAGRPEVGVLAILDERLATALFDAIALAHLQGPSPTGGSTGRVDVSMEVE